MTLTDYLKAFRHRWLVIVLCTLVAGAVMWVVTPSRIQADQRASSYTATATLLVGGAQDTTSEMGRIALYLTTGEIPVGAAKRLGYDGDPAVLASGLTVTPVFTANALTVSTTEADGERAAAVANAFADETVAYFGTQPQDAGQATVSVLQAATPIPNVASGGFVVPPSRAARTAVAALLGLLLGLALALVIERLDSRLRTRDAVADALDLPIVAEVPRLGRAQRHGPVIGVVEQPLSPYAESYRAARTAISHTPIHHIAGRGGAQRPLDQPSASGARLVLVTSANPAEGKTTSVANLAASFAETGQRVLVLDADLRSPDAHSLFDVPQGAGISDYLGRPEDSSLESLIRPTSVLGVRIMTAGTRLAHPESLASRMSGLLEETRDLADIVLIDTAPLLAASDVFDLLPLVDTVVLIVRHGRITDVEGRRVSELLGRFQVPLTGVIIVGSPTKGSGRYGYGYGRGYGDQQTRGEKANRGRTGSRPAVPPVVDASGEPQLESRQAGRTSSSA